MSRHFKFLGMGASLLSAAVLLTACATSTGSADSSTSSQPDPVTTLAATSTTTTQAGSTTTIDATTSDPTATYTGGACDYDGPSEFDLNSTVTFTVTNESDTTDVGFAIWDFPEDVTSEEIHEQGIFEFVTFGNFESIAFSPTAIGESEELTAFFDTPGQWGLNCYDESENVNNGAGLDYVTMFTVNE